MKPGNRQSICFEKVPIHAKLIALGDERKVFFLTAFLLMRKGLFTFRLANKQCMNGAFGEILLLVEGLSKQHE